MKLKYLLVTVVAFAVIVPVAAVGKDLLAIGKKHVILCREKATAMEEYAAETLQKYIARSTGMKLKITAKESSPAIRIAFDEKLKPEEHLVKVTPKGDLLISGGFPAGVYYGAFEFLEKVMNCRFLAPDEEYVPRLKKITFPKDLLLRGVPFFNRRGVAASIWQPQMSYLTKLRYSGMWIKDAYVDPYRFGTTGWGHSFHRLSKHFPKDKTEYFSLTADGKRLRSRNGSGPGQLCLTHPDVRKLVAERMIKAINDADKWTAGHPDRNRQLRHLVYSVGKNDNQDDCLCPGCRKEVARYKGNHAGLFMDFVSDIARRVGKVHKHVLIYFLAYTTDEVPVPGYKLPPNVIVVTAQLGDEFMTRVNRDSMRSIHHPNNAKAKEYMLKWRKTGMHYGIWDYWVLFRQPYPAPMTNVSALVENIRFYGALKMEHVYAETHINSSVISFLELRHYLASKLLVDPTLDEKPIIEEFMRLYYGKGAPAMTAYLKYLEKRMLEEPLPLGNLAPGARRYLDKNFYLQAEKFFQEAEKAVGSSQKHLRRIGQERIPVDHWVLHEYKKLGIKPDIPKVVARLKQNHEWCAGKYFRKNDKAKKIWLNNACTLIDICVNAPPLPQEFRDKKYFDFWGPKLTRHSVHVEKVEDPDSPVKTVCRLGEVRKGFHNGKMELAVYDWTAKKHLLRRQFKAGTMPQDEKYHWYKVGRTKLTARTQLIFHPSWTLSQKSGNAVFDPLEPNAEYELHVSVKVTGPAYVKGSGKPNAVYLDRIVFVECAKKR